MRDLLFTHEYWSVIVDIAILAHQNEEGFRGIQGPQFIPEYLIHGIVNEDNLLETQIIVYRGGAIGTANLTYANFENLVNSINAHLHLPNEHLGPFIIDNNNIVNHIGSSELAAMVFLHPRLAFVETPNGRRVQVS